MGMFLPLRVNAVLRAMTKLLRMRERSVVRFSRDAVGEIILACIAREIREGQHHDGKMRGVGPRCWCIRYDGRRSVHTKEIPRAARNDDERDDPCAEQHEYWTLLWYGGLGRLRLGRPADRERINPDRLGDVFQLDCAQIAHGEIEPRLHLPIGIFGQTDGARLGDTLPIVRQC